MNWGSIARFAIRYGYLIIVSTENAYRVISRKNYTDMKRLGLFSPEQENLLIEAVGQHVKLKNKLYTKLAKYGVRVLIRGIDNFGFEKIRAEWRRDLIPIIDAAILGEKERVRGLTTDLLNKRINIRRFDDEQELILFDSITKCVALAIDFMISKK